VPEEAVRRAVAPMSLEDWVEAGLLAPPEAGGNVSARVKLMPVLDRVFAADKVKLGVIRPPSDFVVPPGGTTLQLAHAMIRQRSRRTLDLGTGCGALACVAAAHSDRVVATDVNPRALDFVRFNLRLNGLERVDCLKGDWLDPVADQRFDQIVCNPPFVITPKSRLLFRDSGMRGDAFCRSLLQTTAQQLEEGGFCQMNCNFAHQRGESWRDGLTEWFHDLGCDAVVWLLSTDDVSAYAMTWIISTESQDSEEVTRLFDQWMDYYEREGIEAVSYLLVTLRRREAGENWTQIEDFPRWIMGPCGKEVLRSFAHHGFLAAHSDVEALLACRFRLASEARIEQRHAMSERGLAVCEAKLRLVGDVQHTMNLDGSVVGLIARCDGRTPLRDLANQLAATQGLPPEEIHSTLLQGVRSLLLRGVLCPVDEE
jgi:methylase of polypeptide subunit release factors